MKDDVRIGVREPITDVTAGVIDYRYLVFQIFRLSALPVWKLSSTVTSCSLIRTDARLDPINPAPPVTGMSIRISQLCWHLNVLLHRENGRFEIIIPPIAPLTTTIPRISFCTLLIAK